MPRPKTSAEFRDAVQRVFESVAAQLRNERKTPASEIARLLGVTRQTAYQYLNGTAIPGPDRLAKVLKTWRVKLEIRGQRFDEGAFSPVSSAVAVASSPRQIRLDFEDLSASPAEIVLDGTDSKLRIDVKGSTLTVAIDLDRSG